MIVYLAGPIDRIKTLTEHDWRDVVKRGLNERGATTFCPYDAFSVSSLDVNASKDDSLSISTMNRQSILSCNVVFALVNEFAFGTIREIEFAKANGIQTVVWDPGGTVSRSIEAQDLSVFVEMDSAIEHVLSDAG